MDPTPRFPLQARAGRRLVQGLVALAGWVLFAYWWWVVFTQRVSRRDIVFTVIFVAATTAIAIVVTGIWSLHNKRLHRRRRPRARVHEVREDYAADILGRPSSFSGGVDRVRQAPFVRVLVEGGRKVYHPSTVE